MPAAAPEWPLVALDAFHPVADDTPRPAAGIVPLTAGVLLPTAGVLPGIAPVLDYTFPLIDPVLDDNLLALDGTFPPVAGVLDHDRPDVERAVQQGWLADLPWWSYSSLFG